jgi:hypothetical protein
MELQEDVIVDIPKDRVKFFGGTGKMLLPGSATVAALIKKIPKRKLITTNLLCKELTVNSRCEGFVPLRPKKLSKRLPMAQAKISLAGHKHERRAHCSVSWQGSRSGSTFSKRGFHHRHKRESIKGKKVQRKPRLL